MQQHAELSDGVEHKHSSETFTAVDGGPHAVVSNM